MIKSPVTAPATSKNTAGTGRFLSHPHLIRLGMVAAWLAIFMLWASWLLSAWFYVQAIFTDLDAVYNWHDILTAEAIRAASAGLGVSPDLFAWMQFGMELTLVATFGIAGTILFRHKQDGFGAFLGVSLVLIGTRIGGPVTFILFTKWPVLEQSFSFLSGLAFVAFGALLYLFPDGRFVLRWMRWLLPLMVGQMVWSQTGMPGQLGVVFALIYLGIGLGVQTYRYRRLSDSVARRHLRWVIASFAAFVVVIAAAWLIAPNAVTNMRPPSPSDLLVMLILMPMITAASISFVIALSVAILRDGLYNLKIFINRALVYGGLTAVILFIYALTVGGLSLLFQAQNNLLISLLATGLIAVFFQPVRERLQRGANRLIYGERDDPAAVLAQLGQRLEAISQPDAVLPTIVETVAHALKLPYVAIVLQEAGEQGSGGAGGKVVATYPSPLASHLSPLTFPLVYQSETMGQLQVAPRSPGEALSAADERVLRQVALQVGTAVHALRLTHDLQQSRIRIVTTREEERRRLRRDLHDELGPLIASQGLKLAAVRELMQSDPETAVRLLDDVLAKNQNTVADVRRLVYNLRPPTLDELGLVGAIREYVENSSGQMVLKVTLTTPPAGLPLLSAAVEAAAYRIVLEAFTNVVRHAGAKNCEISLRLGSGDWRLETKDYLVSSLQSLVIQVEDDGKGLNENGRRGIGLNSMRERAAEVGGSIEIVSSEVGVRVTAVLPI